MSLSEATKKIIKATAPVLAEHGTKITSTMYKNMFSNHPELKSIFNQRHQVPEPGETIAAQPKALAQAVHAYASNIDDLSVLSSAIERIAEKHVASNVVAEHYDIVGSELIGALKQVLGDAASPDIVDAWTQGYQFLAGVFIDVEKKKMQANAEQSGGWAGLRDFVIDRKVAETDFISSFYLKPKDGGSIPQSWKAGKYVGIRQKVSDFDVQRTYSISSCPGDEYIRITVKKEEINGLEGLVSSKLHSMSSGEVLHLTMPCGDFVLHPTENSNTPLVLMGLGIGLTPLYPMAREAVKTSKNPVHILLSARDESSIALQSDFQKLQKEYPEQVKVQNFFKTPTDSQNVAQVFSFDNIWSKVPHNGDYYFCGPAEWMEEVNKGLRSNQLKDSQIHFEFFGPTLQL